MGRNGDRLDGERWVELTAIREPDLFWDEILGALILIAGDPDSGRQAKFDPQTAPPLKGARATEERARLALLLSAFGTLTPQHTEAWPAGIVGGYSGQNL